MDKTWIVIAYDSSIGGHMAFHVRNAASEFMARKAIKEEYIRQGWGNIDMDKLDAYSIPRFRGKRNIAQICKVYAPQETKEPPLSDGMPRVEYV